RELDLSGNELTEFILNGALLKLERLNLSGALKGGNVFIDGNLLPEIKGINLSNCGLYDYSFKCIKGLFDLQYLNLNGNLMTKIPDCFFESKMLVEIDLSNIPTNFNFEGLNSFHSLSSINISNMRLSMLPTALLS